MRSEDVNSDNTCVRLCVCVCVVSNECEVLPAVFKHFEAEDNVVKQVRSQLRRPQEQNGFLGLVFMRRERISNFGLHEQTDLVELQHMER